MGCWTSALVLKLNGQWTYGVLANHIWSYAGSGFNDKCFIRSAFQRGVQ
jgi:hypothetical protein